MKSQNLAKIAFIGGSGLYEIEEVSDIKEIDILTPFGKPSDKITLCSIERQRCAFLPRHGKGHIYTPSELNQRANMFALKSIGVEQIVAFTACGSLKEELKPKDFVIPDQIFDRTKNRVNTFFSNGIVAHISFADPFCGDLRQVIYESAKELDITTHLGGVYVCIEGPQFSTKAESEENRRAGFSVVGMTAIPEAKLAREAEMCYANISMITDFDCWKAGEEVTNEGVLEYMKSNILNAKKLIKKIAPKLAERKISCSCREALKTSLMTAPSKMLASPNYKNLALLLDKYVKN
ncbi:MAG: S-methyl-5'-thioadenosine phosphorylase [Elusimicrobiota bacterium]|jgi:5'-methylthioadenosine phosphorylase|nr:S-methyl-5'-thioadenosine phosphorylase [Elusimicrobiota bacterium]